MAEVSQSMWNLSLEPKLDSFETEAVTLNLEAAVRRCSSK